MTDELKEAIEYLKERVAKLKKWKEDGDLTEAIDTVVMELEKPIHTLEQSEHDYLDQYTDELKRTALPHINKIEVLIRKQHRSPQEITWHIAEASSIVGKAYYRGFGNGFDEGIKFKQQRKDANKDRKQG